MPRIWIVTDHACRACFGRVMLEVGPDLQPTGQVRCADCGLERPGNAKDPHKAICACGHQLRKGVNAGFRCKVNPEVTPEVPAEIVVVHEGEANGG